MRNQIARAMTVLAAARVPDATWGVACDALGDEGSAELVFLVGSYSLLSTALNGFDVPVPE